jgi:hypothetical protein
LLHCVSPLLAQSGHDTRAIASFFALDGRVSGQITI